MVSFTDISPYSSIIDSNEFFIQYYNPAATFRFDSNFFQLLFTPAKEEFELIEEMHRHFSEVNHLKHVKFYWPPNQGILPQTLDYLSEQGYGLEKLELYSIDPAHFKGSAPSSKIEVKRVSSSLLETFKEINYIEDKITSENFAEKKQPFYDSLFTDSSIAFLLAFYGNEPAGSCIMVEGEKTIELDDLFTLKEFRLKGVAGHLQQAVMNEAQEKKKDVILVADAEDSPRDMYKKLGYQYEGFRIGAQKTIEDDNE